MSTNVILNKNHGGRNKFFRQANAVLPLDPQHQSLLQYIDNGKAILDEVRMSVSLVQSNSGDTTNLQKSAKRLAEFCIDTDGWGFDTLYKVAFGLQTLLVHSFNKVPDDFFREILDRGVVLLSSLLDQCESEYHQRLAVADMLDSFTKAACH